MNKISWTTTFGGILLLAAIVSSYAQSTLNPLELNRYNGTASGNDVATDITLDKAGNIYVTGTSLETVGDTSEANFDITTIKYAPDGTQLWAASYDGPSPGASPSFDQGGTIEVDEAGNVVVAGTVGDGSSLSPARFALLKYDAEGNLLWDRLSIPSAGGADSSARPEVRLNADGNIFVSGTFDDDSTVFTSSYDEDGTLIWSARTPQNRGQSQTAFEVDEDGNAFVAFAESEAAQFTRYAVIKYGEDGDVLWVRNYEWNAPPGPGEQQDRPAALDVDDQGNVYVTGSSSNGRNLDIATVRFDSDGSQDWDARHNSTNDVDDIPIDIEVDDSGNVYVMGFSGLNGTAGELFLARYDTSGNQAWLVTRDVQGSLEDAKLHVADNGRRIHLLMDSQFSGGTDYQVLVFNSNGTLVSRGTFNGAQNGEDLASDLFVDGNQRVFVTGASFGGEASGFDYSTVRFSTGGTNVPPGAVAPFVRITSPSNDAFFALPARVVIRASARDDDGKVTKVDFFQGSTLLGSDTSAPFRFVWRKVQAGTYELSATAVDDQGVESFSEPVNIRVGREGEDRPRVSISASTDRILESDLASGRFTIEVDGTGADAETFILRLNVLGTAENGEDYQTIVDEILLSGQTGLTTIDLAPLNDLDEEANETVIVQLEPDGNYIIEGKRSARIVIVDDDSAERRRRR